MTDAMRVALLELETAVREQAMFPPSDEEHVSEQVRAVIARIDELRSTGQA